MLNKADNQQEQASYEEKENETDSDWGKFFNNLV
jgi:hypothetical protein